ncbi:MAG: ribbon-helix-helix protein, CopG family [Armatimonadetes bacterium]|nr:ribbon-helix-helix protein, CopG family [Armatimonadota bacterium]
MAPGPAHPSALNQENIMKRSTKITITLPDEVYAAVERERLSRGESRSAFFRDAAEKLLRREGDMKDLIERYVQGYRNHPETEEEEEFSRVSSYQVLSGEPWE